MYTSGTDNYYYKRIVFLSKALQGTIVLYRTTKTNNKNNNNANQYKQFIKNSNSAKIAKVTMTAIWITL